MPARARRPADRSPRPAPPADPGLAAVLAEHDGTVTDLLEQRAGEALEADVRAQRCGPAPAANPLGLGAGEELLERAVLLRGCRSGRAYVYAESAIAPARLPPAVRRQLEQSRDPIGRVLVDHRVAVRRELLPGPATANRAGTSLGRLLAGAPLSRRYRILLETGPAFAVDEWFLPPAADALLASAPPG